MLFSYSFLVSLILAVFVRFSGEQNLEDFPPVPSSNFHFHYLYHDTHFVHTFDSKIFHYSRNIWEKRRWVELCDTISHIYVVTWYGSLMFFNWFFFISSIKMFIHIFYLRFSWTFSGRDICFTFLYDHEYPFRKIHRALLYIEFSNRMRINRELSDAAERDRMELSIRSS